MEMNRKLSSTELQATVVPNKGQHVFNLTLKECPVEYRKAKDAFESDFFRLALSKYAGNVSRTARAIGISRRNLTIKINRFGIDMNEMRSLEPGSYEASALATNNASNV
jgi:DNA-binding NtrC family response regulator